jgi:hypothetical protein
MESKKCPFCAEEINVEAIKCKHCGSMLDISTENKTPDNQAEEILADVGVNLFRGIESVGGRLKITNRRIVFEPTAINLQKIPVEIPYTDISEVGKRNSLGIVPNGMLVKTKAGVEYKFVLMGREKIIDLIQSKL